MEIFKICKNCGAILPATFKYFFRNKAYKDGFQSKCRFCKNLYDKEYNEAHKTKVALNKKVYKEAHKEQATISRINYQTNNKENIRLYNLNYNVVNKETLVKSRNEYRVLNREQINKQKREHYVKNRERLLDEYRIYRLVHKAEKKIYFRNYAQSEHGKIIIKHISQNRRARIKKLIYTFSINEWNECLSHFNNECAYCGNDNSTLAQEHVIPVVKGGNYVSQNIVPSCKSCNSRKHDSDMETWYKKQNFYNDIRFKKICEWSNIKNNIQQLSIF